MNVEIEKIRVLPIGAKSVFFDSRREILATWRCSMYPQQYLLQFWEIESGKLLKSIDLSYFVKEKGYAPSEVCFTPDWKRVIVGCREAARGPEGKIHLIDVETGKDVGKLPGHLSNVCSIIASPEGNLVVSGSWNGDIKVWNLRSLEEVTMLKDHKFNVQALAFNPTGTSLVSGSGTSMRSPPDIILWDSSTWTKTRETDFKVERRRKDVTSLQFSSDGRMLAVGGGTHGTYDVALSILDGVTLKVLQTLMTDAKTYACVIGVQFNSEGTLLVSGHNDGTIKLWNVNTGEKIEGIQENIGRCAWGIALSQDGSMLATTSQSPGDLTKIWSLS
jgi:WD40 repeat protein